MTDQIEPTGSNEPREEIKVSTPEEIPCTTYNKTSTFAKAAVDKPVRLPIGKGMKILFYLLSFLCLPGIIFGAVFYSKNDEEYRRLGKNCLFIALAPLFFWIFITILALFLGQTGDIFTDRIRDVPY